MKATGIVRRIDDLGRIVVPKEIRRTLRIREGDPLEIYTDHEGEIILKKYSPIGELGVFAQTYVESMASLLAKTVCITDRDQIVAAAGPNKKELLGKEIKPDVEEMIHAREMITAKSSDKKYIKIADCGVDFTAQAGVTIICEGDAIGSVFLLEKEEKKEFDENDLKIISVAADFLGRQMEG